MQMKVEDGLLQREIHARMHAQQAEQVGRPTAGYGGRRPCQLLTMLSRLSFVRESSGGSTLERDVGENIS